MAPRFALDELSLFEGTIEEEIEPLSEKKRNMLKKRIATKHAVQSETTQEGESKDRLRQLIKERKSHRAEGQDAKQISKQIRREIRAITRAVKGAKIKKIMQSFKGFKFIAATRRAERSTKSAA